MQGVISSNILFDTEDDCPFRWENRRELLSEIVTENKPLIIATQEGKRPQLIDLESLLTEYRLIESHREWIKTRMYPSFFIHKSVDVIKSGDIWLSKTPHIAGSSSFESMFPRLMCWAIIELKSKQYFLINTHLDHIKGETRKEQIKVLINESLKINTSHLPIILTGDFNEGPLGNVRLELTQNFKDIIDPWIQLGKKEESSYHKNLTVNPPLGFNGERIDWILHDKSIGCEEVRLLKNSYKDLYPSDHYPVFAALRL